MLSAFSRNKTSSTVPSNEEVHQTFQGGSVDQQIENLLRESFLREFLENETVTDISFNGEFLTVQDNLKGSYVPYNQPDQDEVFDLGKKIANVQRKELANSNPILDTEISYYRVNFVHSSVSPSGCTFSIRVSKPRLAIRDLEDLANREVVQLLDVLIQSEANLILSGRTGSGKTEMQKSLVKFIEDKKKILLLEDTMDTHLKELFPEKDIKSWRTLTDDARENKITFHEMIKAGLRNNPDWLIIAETRGAEAYDMLESALTGHSIITTIHAKGAPAIPSRIISMIGQEYQLNEILLGKDLVDTIKIGIHLAYEETNEGFVRFIREIVEYTDYTEKGIEYNTLYRRDKVYDEKTGQYENRYVMNPLTKGMLEELKYKELYHLIPSCFKEQGDS